VLRAGGKWHTSEASARRPPMESFRGVLLRHRGRTGLTQGQLADRIGVARRTIQDWESGVNFPTAGRLQAVIEAFLEAGGLSGGQEAEEAEALWSSAERESSRMHAPFDSAWFTQVLDQRATPAAVHGAPPKQARQEWGEAPDTAGFVGRAEELAVLRAAVVDERCRLLALLGMGGIGKTSLAAKVAQEVAPSFECLLAQPAQRATAG
jgi:transcriptional regulator with XRE-family HTH domain